jgi:hypothetical protein
MTGLKELLELKDDTIEQSRGKATPLTLVFELIYGLLVGGAIAWVGALLWSSVVRSSYPPTVQDWFVLSVTLALPPLFLAAPIGRDSWIAGLLVGVLGASTLFVVGAGSGGWTGP